MGDIVSAVSPAVSAAIAAAGAVWALRYGLLPDAGPSVPGVLLAGATALTAIGLAVLAWPEPRRELLRWCRHLVTAYQTAFGGPNP